MEEKNITDIGAKALAYAFTQLKSLILLNKSDYSISVRVFDAFAAALPELKNISHLSLHGNKISVTGVVAIATALPRPKSLTELDLSGNDISDTGSLSLPHCHIATASKLSWTKAIFGNKKRKAFVNKRSN